MSEGDENGEGRGPPSALSPNAVAGQVENVVRDNKEGLSGYEKCWLQSAADYLRYLSAEGEGGDVDAAEAPQNESGERRATEDGEIWIERQEWSGGEFVLVFDSDHSEDEPAAVLPSGDADEIATQILKPRLVGMAESWRSGSFADNDGGKGFERASNVCADDLEELLEDG